MVARITHVSDRTVCGVSHDVCEACCRCLQPGEELNPVVASLVYNATVTILRAGGMPGCDRGECALLQERIVTHLAIVTPGLPDRIFPPDAMPRVDLRGPHGQVAPDWSRRADGLMLPAS